MKSICIKITNKKTIEYLLEKLNNLTLDDVYFSCKKFKIYTNVIIHFKGKNEKLFFKIISKTLSVLVIDLFEEKLIDTLIKSEYFYFNIIEQKQIFNNTLDDLYNYEESIFTEKQRFTFIYHSFFQYFKENRSLVLKGFITFRIRKYLETLLEQIDKSVNKFIIEKEYSEFISLLKMYVNSEPSLTNRVHLIYYNYKPTLLDDKKNVIKMNENLINSKFLSDITFSSNDFALNTLLNLMPKKIHIHLIDQNIDEFINTIKLIFENRVVICTDCSICKLYKKIHATN